MPTKAAVLTRIRTTGLLPVLRAHSESQALALIDAIAAGGIDILEITMTVPGAVHLLRRLTHDRPDLLLGAGTVLDPETARACILEGAQFIVSPALNLATVELCHRYSIPVLPGALTPTEIVTAWAAGADMVKIFPANALGGASYLRALKAPLPHIEMIPTGGISLSTAADFLHAGAIALGIGADLVDPKAIASKEPHKITEKARQYLSLVRDFQTTHGHHPA